MEEWGPEGIGLFLARQLSGVFDVEEWHLHGGAVRFRGTLLASPEKTLEVLRQRLEPYQFVPLLSSPREILVFPAPALATGAGPEKPWPQVVLFAATVLTTLFVGALQAGVDPIADPTHLLAGLPFSVSLLSILLVHEMGHYFVARRYGVRVSLPYFIPVPLGIGTFGALIRMKSPIVDRRSLFDIGIAGPVAGLCLAIPVLMIGLRFSDIVPAGSRLGDPLGTSLLFDLVVEATLGPLADGMTVFLHPAASAAWFGFFITALNLLPLGQLDGGHIAYALLGRHAEKVAFMTAIILLLLGVVLWPGWLVWAFLAFMLGLKHPPPLNDVTPLDAARRAFAVGAFILLLCLITPSPFPRPDF